MQEIPIYLFTGFMDSGKTTLIKETLLENGFADQGKSLIICCEDGEVEYDEAELKKINASLVMVENEEDFTADFLNAINMKYLPDQVFIEYNWNLGNGYAHRDGASARVDGGAVPCDRGCDHL